MFRPLRKNQDPMTMSLKLGDRCCRVMSACGLIVSEYKQMRCLQRAFAGRVVHEMYCCIYNCKETVLSLYSLTTSCFLKLVWTCFPFKLLTE